MKSEHPSPNTREREIFLGALDQLSLDDRAAYLARVCGNDKSLRASVQALLETYKEDDFIERVASATRPPSLATEKPGDTIGRYKLLEEIGEGGWGVVYMAEQKTPFHRRVALKVVKLGMDTKQVVGRFEAERQALAMMNHSNIAKVFDAGATNTGRPYFVMELVRGRKITDYCDGQKLSFQQRLDLFLQVCHAVQHAHQNGIVHRDIKPSNILVTEEDGKPVPKVIDFGIAKATTDVPLTDITLFTAREQFIGTPAYMSPEQAGLAGPPIDQRTDIYSLGVLLYELLAGCTPLDTQKLLEGGYDAVRQTIRERQSPCPAIRLNGLEQSELAKIAQCRRVELPSMLKSLRGDLERIVMKCLEIDRTRRYQSATDLATEIQRYQKGEAITAPVFRRDRMWRGLNRKAMQIACTIAALSLILGLWILWSKSALARVGYFTSPLIVKWNDVTLGHWNLSERADLYLTKGDRFYVFNGQGTPLIEWPSTNRPGVNGFMVNMAEDLDGHGLDDALLSWCKNSDPELILTVLNQHQFALKTFQSEGRMPDTNNVGPTSRITAQRIVQTGKGPERHRRLLAFLQTNRGGSPRGLCCFDYETEEPIWKYLTGPSPSGLEVLDLSGNGESNYIFGSASPNNTNQAPNGTDDFHAYIFALSTDGKLLWTNQLAGAYAIVTPLAIDFTGAKKKELLAWVRTPLDVIVRAPEVGLVVKLDDKGQVITQYRAGACLRSCFAADMNGDGKQEVLCSDCLGKIHILNSDLTLRKKVGAISPHRGSVVDLEIVAITKLRKGNRPQVVLRASQYREVPKLVDGKPNDPPIQTMRDEDTIIVLDADLNPIATQVVGKNRSYDEFWDVKVGDVLGNDQPQIVSLTDHVELLQLTR